MKVREVLERLHKEGWAVVRMKGSHRQLKHAVKRGSVTVSGHLGDDVHKGTLGSIRRQAQWEDES